jgi:hypothetical protein
MNKIETIDLAALHNDEHYQFMSEVDASIGTTKAAELNAATAYPLFQQALKDEDAAMKVDVGSSLSAELQALDKQRGNTWNAINKRIDSAVICPFADEVASGKVLERIFNQYGDPREVGDNKTSSVITKLVTELLQAGNATHLEKVCVATWVSELGNENASFIDKVKLRNTEESERPNGDVRVARQVVDPLYKIIVSKVNDSFFLNEAKPVAIPFANELNLRIKKYKAIIAARETLNSKKKKKSSGTDGTKS